jgi:hypothetical protein
LINPYEGTIRRWWGNGSKKLSQAVSSISRGFMSHQLQNFGIVCTTPWSSGKNVAATVHLPLMDVMVWAGVAATGEELLSKNFIAASYDSADLLDIVRLYAVATFSSFFHQSLVLTRRLKSANPYRTSMLYSSHSQFTTLASVVAKEGR